MFDRVQLMTAIASNRSVRVPLPSPWLCTCMQADAPALKRHGR